jgi:hypothetical protein
VPLDQLQGVKKFDGTDSEEIMAQTKRKVKLMIIARNEMDNTRELIKILNGSREL